MDMSKKDLAILANTYNKDIKREKTAMTIITAGLALGIISNMALCFVVDYMRVTVAIHWRLLLGVVGGFINCFHGFVIFQVQAYFKARIRAHLNHRDFVLQLKDKGVE